MNMVYRPQGHLEKVALARILGITDSKEVARRFDMSVPAVSNAKWFLEKADYSIPEASKIRSRYSESKRKK